MAAAISNSGWKFKKKFTQRSAQKKFKIFGQTIVGKQKGGGAVGGGRKRGTGSRLLGRHPTVYGG